MPRTISRVPGAFQEHPPLSAAAEVKRTNGPIVVMTAVGVRRDKAALSSGHQAHPSIASVRRNWRPPHIYIFSDVALRRRCLTWVRLGRADHLPGARMRGRCSPVSGPIRDGWIVAALGHFRPWSRIDADAYPQIASEPGGCC